MVNDTLKMSLKMENDILKFLIPNEGYCTQVTDLPHTTLCSRDEYSKISLIKITTSVTKVTME